MVGIVGIRMPGIGIITPTPIGITPIGIITTPGATNARLSVLGGGEGLRPL